MQTILLVDDDEVLRTLMFDILEQTYQILEASDGQKGLNTFEENKQKIKLIITDINMPIMSGFEMVKIIRNLSTTVKIMVFSSSINEPQKLFKATGIYIDKFLQKPATLNEIKETIKELIQN